MSIFVIERLMYAKIMTCLSLFRQSEMSSERRSDQIVSEMHVIGEVGVEAAFSVVGKANEVFEVSDGEVDDADLVRLRRYAAG